MKQLVFATLGLLVLSTAAKAQNAWDEITPALGSLEVRPEGWLFEDELFDLLDTGEALFDAKFTSAEGAGRPRATQAAVPHKTKTPLTQAFSRTSGPDAAACSSCHNEPFSGGAGDFTTNVFTSSGFANAVFDTTDPEFSNERGTNHLFGAGLLELLAREMTAELQQRRTDALIKARSENVIVQVPLITKGIDFGALVAFPDGTVDPAGVQGVDHDLVIKPFTQKGTVRSLRQFTVNAFNHHHGMQADERFGETWTGERDFDEDGFETEMSEADISAVVAWQATLRAPIQRDDLPEEWSAAAAEGAQVFERLHCSSCHRTTLPLKSLDFHDPGPLDGAGVLRANDVPRQAIYDLSLMPWIADLEQDAQGNFLVPLFGDLKRHVMTDQDVNRLGNERVPQGFVDTNVFITAELWGLGSTAPFGHRNDITTIDEIIRAHGGEARGSRDAFVEASDKERSNLIAFLKSLVIVE